MRTAIAVVRSRGRVLVATGALAGVAALASFPAQAYRAQSSQRARLEAELAELSAGNRSLQERARALESDGEIERLARLHHNLVRPGEEAFSILPAPDEPAVAAVPASSSTAAGPADGAGDRGWWPALQRLWARVTSIF